jgi:hypothetical protein
MAMQWILTCAWLVGAGFAGASSAQSTWYVNGSCGDDSWSASSPVCLAPDGPKRTIQAAMDVAATGDLVLVADGIYRGPGNKWLSFPGRSFALRSQNGPASCVIDLENSGLAFFLVADESPEAVIQGFTIQNGNSGNGGAFFIHHASEVVVSRCIVRDNFCSSAGGAVHCDTNASPTFVDCAFLGNESTGPGGALAFLTGGSSPRILGCLIAGNTAAGEGGGIFFGGFGDSPALVNSTVADNATGGLAGGIFVNSASGVSIVNSIVWGNGGGALVAPGAPAVSHSDIQGGWPGLGNLDADPLFRGGYRLTHGSPCIDSGNDAALPDELALDLAGRPRRLDGDADGVATVDMGALEFGLRIARAR